MAGEEVDEVGIERQLEQQLEEQRASIAAVDEALAAEPANAELLAVHEELLLAIKDTEEGLLHLKQSRLLKEMDTIFTDHESAAADENVKAEPLDPSQVEPEPLELEEFSVGSKCRFRHTDGRWYNGRVVGLEGSDTARVSFLTPTSESMLMCKFFLQQRCRFGSNCRSSHGFLIPISSLKEYIPTLWHHSLVGTNVLAASGNQPGVWRNAELESWDDEHKLGQVVFLHDGSSAKLGSDSLSISKYAEITDDDDEDSEEDSSFSERSELSGEEDNNQGLGFLQAATLQRGIQTETAVFAKWEHHTRGIASKMMASMGYREGMGLGVSGQGIVDPVSVKVLPPKQSLDHAVASNKNKVDRATSKKRSRGGKRKRGKKYAELARAAKAEEGQKPDVFSFINKQLYGQDDDNGSGAKYKKGSGEGDRQPKNEDRRSLVVYEDEVKELRSRVEKLEEMVKRNRGKDKAVYEAASRKLSDTQKALADAEATHASASTAVVSKEKEKKWLKF
ncbi:Zinc finger CCCH domain-containing protein 18 [Ananas comosus]|uniref:Zinc finger CCCH domain-containing protein 18 n=1 Tax=Ananas comosus TaxID=4615 RepID=A0A199VQ12_ANACO|nr:Zinc finger CCCH domain-containing protein 18 [Ananas comosus]